MSVWYGSSAGRWGYRAYQWPPYGRRGLSGGLGQDTVDVSTLTPVGDGTFTDSSGNVYDSSGNIISSSTSLTDQSALQNLPTLPSNAPTAIEYPTQGGDNHIDARDHRQHADYGATSGGLQPAGGLRPKTPYQLEVFLHELGHVWKGHSSEKSCNGRVRNCRPENREEYEAEAFALDVMRREGVPIDADVLGEAQDNVVASLFRDARAGRPISREALKFAQTRPDVKESQMIHRRNPAEASEEVYEEFHGQPSEYVTEVSEEEHYHSHLAQLGV